MKLGAIIRGMLYGVLDVHAESDSTYVGIGVIQEDGRRPAGFGVSIYAGDMLWPDHARTAVVGRVKFAAWWPWKDEAHQEPSDPMSPDSWIP